MVRRYRTRDHIGSRLNKIRHFRNRIFHYEPIWYSPLERQHREILETISWIEPAMKGMVSAIDSFPSTNTKKKRHLIEREIRKFC
jgi:hypothetical protein